MKNSPQEVMAAGDKILADLRKAGDGAFVMATLQYTVACAIAALSPNNQKMGEAVDLFIANLQEAPNLWLEAEAEKASGQVKQ